MTKSFSNDNIKEKAKQATSKKANLGMDVDISQFTLPQPNTHKSVSELSDLSSREENIFLRKAGFSDNDSWF